MYLNLVPQTEACYATFLQDESESSEPFRLVICPGRTAFCLDVLSCSVQLTLCYMSKWCAQTRQMKPVPRALGMGCKVLAKKLLTSVLHKSSIINAENSKKAIPWHTFLTFYRPPKILRNAVPKIEQTCESRAF